MLRDRQLVIARLQRLGADVIEVPADAMGASAVEAYLGIKRAGVYDPPPAPTRANRRPDLFDQPLSIRNARPTGSPSTFLLTKLEKKGAAALTSDELLQLPLLYRATLSSLSIARATSLDKALLDHLEALSIRGYFLVYGVRESRWNRLRRFVLYDWPAAVRSVWKETVIISLIIVLGALTSLFARREQPRMVFQFRRRGNVGRSRPARDGRVPAIDPRSRKGCAAADESESGLHVFATYLFTHNSRVSILSFALGFAFGVPTMMLEYYQGIGLGAMIAVFSSKGLGFDFGGWLFIHGTTELFAAALSGAAGSPHRRGGRFSRRARAIAGRLRCGRAPRAR